MADCANLPVRALWKCVPFSNTGTQEGSIVAFPTLSSLWAHLLLAASIIWLLACAALDCCLLIPPLLSLSCPFPSREQLWQNPPLHPRSSQCAYSRVNTSWLGLCETLHYQESFGSPLRLSCCTICVRKNVWIYILFKVYKWFHFNNILWSSQQPYEASHNDYIYIIQRGNWIFVRLINLAKVP